MCGIAGFADKKNPALLNQMLDKISHRGPDGRGMAEFEDASIGQLRLSIIDLTEKASQPMFNKDHSVCLIFNGELYNFMDVKKDLVGKYEFDSTGDTQVVLHAYEEWGVECLQRFNGMFAFVIYDAKKNLLFGARDRLGEKPLKYFYDGERFVFASEVKALLESIPGGQTLDPAAIDDFLTLQYIPAPSTGFKEIKKLPAAHYFIYKSGKLEIKRYWDVDFTQKIELSEPEWQEMILEKLNKSVASRLISDVPIGALLSGGVDSSAVVAFMAKNVPGKVKTFNIGFDDGGFDEASYAKTVSEMYGTDHTSIRLEAQALLDYLPKLVEHYDAPIGDNSILPTLLVSKITRDFVTVALTGDGGDENFAGYSRYNIVQLNALLDKLPKAITRNLFPAGAKMLSNVLNNQTAHRAERFFETYKEPFYKKYVNYNPFFTNSEKWNLYSADFKSQISDNDTYDIYKEMYDSKLNYLDNALNFDIHTYLPEDLLFKADIASMAWSLELRAPLLDHEFMEMTAKMPSSLKLHGNEKKYIFKKALVEGGILPAEVVYRKKQGFNIPQTKWFKGPLKSYIYESILSPEFLKSGIFDQTALESYLAKYFSTNLNYSNNIFALLMLSEWYRKYL